MDQNNHVIDTQVGTTLQVVISSFSLIGAMFMIGMYATFPQLRQFSFKMVFFLAISDFLGALAGILSATRFTGENPPEGLCYFQAMLQTYANMSSIIWVVIISWTLYSSVILGIHDKSQSLKNFLLSGFVLPIFFVLLPLPFQYYGESGGVWCWIKTESNDSNELKLIGLFMLIEFYFPLWISEAFIIWAISKVIRFLKSTLSTSMAPVTLEIVARLRLYPIILLVCWLPATIERLTFIITGEHTAALMYLHIIFSRLNGVFHMLVYGMTGSVRVVLRDKCFKESNRKANEQELSGVSKQNTMTDLRLSQEYDDNAFDRTITNLTVS